MDKFLSLAINNDLKNDINYNEEQLNFIKEPLNSCKLLGIPGGGKTQSIIGKILYNYSNNIITKNNQFLILTFSRRACNDFIEKGKKQNKILFTTKNIRTIHSIAGKIVYKIMDKKSSSQDTVIISSIDLIENNKEEILNMDDFNNLKVIFVDEAQDISFIQYKFVLKLGEVTNSHIILIGDPNQNIYQFQNGSDQYLIKHPGNTYNLIKNYRSTPHIVNFINNFRPWNSITTQMISTKEDDDILNKKPLIFIGTVEEIIENITNKILKSPFPREEIAIIGPVKKSKPYNDVYTNIGLSLFTNLLNKYNINYVKHYEDTNREEELYNENKKKEDHINLFTIHGSKGLEFHQVFLINFHTKTFGMIPTEEKYKEFKYLWYVGLSRASYDLNIYIEKTKLPWNELKNCPEKLYINENTKPVFINELKFQEEVIPIYNSVTEILGSKKFLDDQLIFDLENIFEYEIETIKIFDISNNKKIKNHKEYSALYGMFIENIFNYYYNKNNKNITADFIIKLKKIINNTIIIPKKYIYGYKILKTRCPFIKDLIKLSHFINIKNKFKQYEEKIYEYLCEVLNNDFDKEFFIDCENDVINYSKDDLLNSINHLENIDETNNLNKGLNIKNIFKITLYYYQKNNETAYLWNTDFTEEINDLDIYIESIINYSKNIFEEFTFHPLFRHPKLAIIGELDMYNDKKIVDIKFSNNLYNKHILQILLYYHIINPSFNRDYELELWNFYLGNKYIIKLNKSNINVYKLLKILSSSIKKKMEKMIFIYDLETTGLEYTNKKIDIIERHFEEYTTSIVPSTGLLKPNYFPFIPFNITITTGITKEDVCENGDNINKFRDEMKELFRYCNKPIFISYNSNSFDHKILLNEKILSYDNCKLLDSKMIIRLFLNDNITNKSLSDIYKHLFNYIPIEKRANSDVKMLISIFHKLCITEEKILNM
jgi:hypothetical protein